jgi:hypothetical protein
VLRTAFAVSLLAACANQDTGTGGEPESGGMKTAATQVAYEPVALASTNVQAALDEVAQTATEARDRAVYIKGPTDLDPAEAKVLTAKLPANSRFSISAEGIVIDPTGAASSGRCTLYVEGQAGIASTTYFTLSGATPIHMSTVLDSDGADGYMRFSCEADGKPLFIRGATLTAIEVGNVIRL